MTVKRVVKYEYNGRQFDNPQEATALNLCELLDIKLSDARKIVENSREVYDMLIRMGQWSKGSMERKQ